MIQSRLRIVLTVFLVSIFGVSAVVQVTAQVPSTRIILGGRAVTLVADAVYAFSSARSRVIAVGGTDQGLGTFLKEIDPAFPSKPTLDRNAAAEVYAAYKPDLAIFKSALKRGVGGALEALGIRVHYLDLETPEDYYRDLEGLGRILGEETRANELIAYYKSVVDTAVRISAGASGKPRVLVVQAVGDAWEVPPASWMQTRIVEIAGGTPVWIGANPGSGWARVGLEQVAAWNPDVILVIDYRRSVDDAVARMRADPRFSMLVAGKSGRIWGFPQDFLSWDQPDTRWALGLLWTVKTLHPDRAASLSIEAEARRFYRLLYGFDEAVFDRVVRPRLTGDHGIR